MPDTKSVQFIHEFEYVMSDVALPQRLTEHYTVSSIFKDTDDKKIYQLCDASGNLFILKSSSGILRDSLRREYDVLNQLVSSHFPEAVDFFEEDGAAYLLRRYVRGIPLCDHAEQLCEAHPLESDFEKALLPLLTECCTIIGELHALHPPMIHRDIKGENFIYSTDTHHLILIDVDAGHEFTPGKSRDTVFAGTYGNAAPEQFGFRQSDVRTDVYGLGKTFLSLLNASENDDSQISTELSAILHKSTAFEPNQRYRSVKELQQALYTLQQKQNKKPADFTKKQGFILLLLGLLIGSAVGSGIGMICSQKFLVPTSSTPFAQASTEPGADQATVEQPSKNALSDIQTNPSGTPATDAAVDSDASIVDRAGSQPLNLFDFQDDVDTLLLAVYNNDADALGVALETLIPKLYAEPELTRNPPEDYANYDSLPDYVRNCSAVDHIRQSLVYRDACLKNTIGSYSNYQNEILSLLRIVIYRTSDADTSCIYKYAHAKKDAVDENDYNFCLSDLLDNVLLAIDNQDGFVRVYEQN